MKAQYKPKWHIGQLLCIIFVGILFSNDINAQCKTYKLAANGDTLNCTKKNGKKEGKWIERIEAKYSNAGLESEGEYKNDKREGLWRMYNLQGDVTAMENYKWGLQNGLSQYFTLDGLEHEENWMAIDPAKKYDTIDVPDLYTPDVYHKTIVKNEGYAMKQGKWTFYDPQTGYIIRTENYIRDSLTNPLQVFGETKTKKVKDPPLTDAAKEERKKKALAAKTKEILDFEKKNKKKKVKVRDGSTGL